jgi:conserved hypothetical protein
MIEYNKNLIYINDDDNSGVDLGALTPKSSRLIVVRCIRCNNPWRTRPRELFYNRTSCPVCRKDKEYNENAIALSPKYYEVLYPMLIDKNSLENRGDTSQYTIDVVCPDCSKAFRITISSAIKRIENNSPICWMCDSRKGGRTGELFIYNYPELVSRIKDEVPDTDFLVSDPRKFMFEYDCGHSEKIRTRNFVWQHKICSECKRSGPSKRPGFLFELKRKPERTKKIEVACSRCEKQLTIQTSSYLRNIKKNNGNYVCGICASSKGVRLSEKLKSPEFAHVFWSEKNEFSPNAITASSGRRVILECEKGHEWSPFAYAIGGCPRCAQSALVSKQEQSLVDFVCSLIGKSRVRTSVRDVIHPKELDIYVPSRGVAIEFNGTYWHSEENGKHRDYHFDKWLSCKDNGVTLISVWEDDWLYRRSVVEHVLESTLLPNEHSLHSNHDAKPLSTQKITTPSVEILEFVKAYGLFEQQCLMDDASFFVTCSDSSGDLVSVSGVFEGPGFADVRSHVCIPGFEHSLSSVVSLLRADGIEVGILECNDYPLPARHAMEDVDLTQSRIVNPMRRCVLYAHNKYFRVSKCDIDDMDHVWNSGYTLWYA